MGDSQPGQGPHHLPSRESAVFAPVRRAVRPSPRPVPEYSRRSRRQARNHEAVPRPRRPACLLPPWAPDVSWTRPHTPAAQPRPLGLGFPGGHAGAAPSSWPSGIPPYGFASHCRPRVRAWTGGCFHRLAVVATATPPPGRGERPEELPDPPVRSSRRAHLTPYTRSSLCKLAPEGDDALRIFKSAFCAQQSGGWET